MRRLWRIHHPVPPAGPGDSLTVEGEEAHHVVRVLRLKAGDPIGVFDGEGTEWRSVIVSADPGRVVVQAEEKLGDGVEAPFEVALFQGLCRSERFEWVVQKATEIGVSAVYGFPTTRAEARAPGPRRIERWRRIAIEACKQSGRRRAPRVEVLETLTELPRDGTVGVVLDPATDSPPLVSVLGATAPSGVWLAVGPEAGFDPAEVGAWTGRGWRCAGLGPRVLRADTAGLVAATIVLERFGDLGS